MVHVKIQTENTTTDNFIYMTFWKRIMPFAGKGKAIGIESRSVVARTVAGEKGHCKGDMKELSGVMELFYILTVVIVTQLCKSKIIELYAKRGEFYCMYIIPQ